MRATTLNLSQRGDHVLVLDCPDRHRADFREDIDFQPAQSVTGRCRAPRRELVGMPLTCQLLKVLACSAVRAAPLFLVLARIDILVQQLARGQTLVARHRPG
jgi:hypothetical protein